MNALIKNKTAEQKEKQPKEKPSTDSLEARQANRHGFAVLYRKELCDCLTSWRMLILFFLLLFVMVVSLNAAIQNMADAISKSNGFNFLKLFTTGSDSIYSFATFMAFLGPLVGIGLGFDSVSNEKSQGTLISLASQPIYRDTIINAKFLAQATCVVITVFAMGGIVCGVGLIRTGLVPEGEEVARILMYLLITAIYICMWLAFSTFLSVVNTHAATSAIIALAIWLCLTLFMNLIATNVANALYPTDGMNAYFNTMKNYNRKEEHYQFKIKDADGGLAETCELISAPSTGRFDRFSSGSPNIPYVYVSGGRTAQFKMTLKGNAKSFSIVAAVGGVATKGKFVIKGIYGKAA